MLQEWFNLFIYCSKCRAWNEQSALSEMQNIWSIISIKTSQSQFRGWGKHLDIILINSQTMLFLALTQTKLLWRDGSLPTFCMTHKQVAWRVTKLSWPETIVLVTHPSNLMVKLVHKQEFYTYVLIPCYTSHQEEDLLLFHWVLCNGVPLCKIHKRLYFMWHFFNMIASFHRFAFTQAHLVHLFTLIIHNSISIN